MILSIQRQCDGARPKDGASDCDVRLVVDTEVADRLDPVGFQKAWVLIAASLGWRRYGAEGQPHTLMAGDRGRQGMYIIPVTKTWVMCPACVTKSGFICMRCKLAACTCIQDINSISFDVEAP